MAQLDASFFKPFVEGTLSTLKVQCGLEISTDKPFIKGLVMNGRKAQTIAWI